MKRQIILLTVFRNLKKIIMQLNQYFGHNRKYWRIIRIMGDRLLLAPKSVKMENF